jgi:hypothetical protein
MDAKEMKGALCMGFSQFIAEEKNTHMEHL